MSLKIKCKSAQCCSVGTGGSGEPGPLPLILFPNTLGLWRQTA